jgi:hypothetical protein
LSALFLRGVMMKCVERDAPPRLCTAVRAGEFRRDVLPIGVVEGPASGA